MKAQAELQNHPHMEIPLDALMMPELEPMGHWARVIHETLLEIDPQRLKEMAEENTLKQFLAKQQELLSDEARKLEKEWRLKNPLPVSANQQERASWYNQAKQSASETLRDEIAKSYLMMKEA